MKWVLFLWVSKGNKTANEQAHTNAHNCKHIYFSLFYASHKIDKRVVRCTVSGLLTVLFWLCLTFDKKKVVVFLCGCCLDNLEIEVNRQNLSWLTGAIQLGMLDISKYHALIWVSLETSNCLRNLIRHDPTLMYQLLTVASTNWHLLSCNEKTRTQYIRYFIRSEFIGTRVSVIHSYGAMLCGAIVKWLDIYVTNVIAHNTVIK